MYFRSDSRSTASRFTLRRRVWFGSTGHRDAAVRLIVQGGGAVSFTGFAQEENGRSVALRVDYGNFSMWIGEILSAEPMLS